MEERRVRVGSVVEWLAAALAVALLVWVVSGPVQRLLGPGVQAAIDGAPISTTPPGVPGGALRVPVMLLLDGREVRQGDLHTRLEQVLPLKYADGSAHVSRARYGERQTRAYTVHGVKFFIVCERTEPNGPMRVAGIFLP